MRISFRSLLALMGGFLFCCQPLAAQDLLALWEGDVANGPDASVLLDSSGNENHGLFIGNAGLVDNGVTGGALNFDGTSHALINTPADGAFDGITDNQAFTIGYWASGGDSNPRNSSTFWANSPEQANTRAIQVHGTWGNGSIFLDIGGCCGPDTRLSGPLEEQFIRGSEGEEWTHFAFTMDEFGDTLIYVNGEVYENVDAGFVAERFGPTAEMGNIEQFNIASNNGGGNQWEGRMDDFFIADGALSESDVQQVFEDGIRSVFDDLPAEPTPYAPQSNVELRLENLDGTLGLAAFVGSGDEEISSWNVEELFTTSAGGQELTVAANLGQIGVAGDGAIGDAGMAVSFGDVSLLNDGADDLVRTFRITANVTNGSDPIIGSDFSTSMTAQITIPGSGEGGGGIPPGVLQGDINQDGLVNFPDFLILSNNFGQAVAASAPVPEPSSGLLAFPALFALAVLRRRRN